MIILIISKNNYISSYIILPFNFSSKKIKTNNNPKEYFEYYINNTIYSKIEINNSPIDFKISMEKFPIFISKKIYLNQNFINTDDNKYSLSYLNIKEAYLISDSFKLASAQINSSNTHLFINDNLSFFLVNEFNDSSQNEEAKIGLNRVKGNQYMDIEDDIDIKGYSIEEKANLIFQLKKKDLINSTLFTIIYNEGDFQENGEIIIGDYPHIYDPLHYSEKDLYSNIVTIYTSPPYNWYSRFREFFYNNESLIITKIFQFSIDHGFIEAPMSVKKYFDTFFNKYNDSCKEDIVNNYNVFYCKNNVIQNFKNLSFSFKNQQSYQYGFLDELKMEFGYNDLFVNENGIYYFQIIFSKNLDWIFGKPIFKKYRIVFDQDKKIYGIYKFYQKENKKENDNTNNPNDNNSNNNKFIIFYVIIIILSLFVIIESIFIIRKCLVKPRNKRPNELKDEYDYDNYLNNDKDKNIINN
jgi:hypothetical protein